MILVSNANPTAHPLAALTPVSVVNYQHGETHSAHCWNYGAERANRAFSEWHGGEAGLKAIEAEIVHFLQSGAHDAIVSALTTARDNVILGRGPAA